MERKDYDKIIEKNSNFVLKKDVVTAPQKVEESVKEEICSQKTVDDWVDLARKYIKSREYNKVYQYAYMAAQEGDPRGMNIVGNCCQHGWIGEANLETAHEWWKKAAELGYLPAVDNVGVYYVNQNNWTEAMKWFEKAANEGYALSQWRIGTYYRDGNNVVQDYLKAYFWFSKAAEQNFASAIEALGGMYKEGKGIPKNLDAAFECYMKVADMGRNHSVGQLINGIYDGIFKPSKEQYLKVIEYGKSALDKQPNLKYILDRVEETAIAKGWVETPKSVETPNPVEKQKIIEATEKLPPVHKSVSETLSNEEKIERTKRELEKIREERKSLDEDCLRVSVGYLDEENFLTKLTAAGYDLEWMTLKDSGKIAYYYLSDMKQADIIVDGLFDPKKGHTNKNRLKMYNDILNKERTTFASRKVDKAVFESLLDDYWGKMINLAVLGKDEKDKAIFITNIMEVLTGKNNIVTVHEIMDKKATEYVACVKHKIQDYQVNIIDAINDPGCVRVMLNSPVEWNAAVIEYDLGDDVSRNTDLLEGWAYWAEYCKIPCLMVYIKIPYSGQDDDLEYLLDLAKEEITECIEQHYEGEIFFFEGLVSEKMQNLYEEEESIFDMFDILKRKSNRALMLMR